MREARNNKQNIKRDSRTDKRKQRNGNPRKGRLPRKDRGENGLTGGKKDFGQSLRYVPTDSPLA